MIKIYERYSSKVLDFYTTIFVATCVERLILTAGYRNFGASTASPACLSMPVPRKGSGRWAGYEGRQRLNGKRRGRNVPSIVAAVVKEYAVTFCSEQLGSQSRLQTWRDVAYADRSGRNQYFSHR